MKKKLRVILDTNILLVSISSNSKYHWVLEKLLNAEYDIIISNADYIITNDKHFDILNNIEFPIMKTLTISEFKNFF